MINSAAVQTCGLLRDTLKTIKLYHLIYFPVAVYVFALIRFLCINTKINKIKKKQNIEISALSGQGRGIPLEIITRQVNSIRERDSESLRELESKKNFWKHILSFFKK